MRFIILFVILFSLQLFAQMTNPVHFPIQSDSTSNKESFLLGLPDNSMMMFWYYSTLHTINSSRSTDEGLIWGEIA